MSKLQTIIDSLANMVQEGLSTADLEHAAKHAISLLDCEPAFLGYKPHGAKEGYPFVSCISVNAEVIHGLPSDYKLVEGDVVKIDLGLIDKGQYDDGATTVLVGHCSAIARRLVKATKEAMEAGILVAKAGNTNHDVAKAIEAVAEREDFGIVRGYGGHGIGEKLHQEPNIPNRVEGMPVKLESGMRICVEPMFSSIRKRDGRVFVDKNGWTVKLEDGVGIAAHFERSITIK